MSKLSAPKQLAGKAIGQVGYGLMGLTAPEPKEYEAAAKAMKTALEKGANFWNGGTIYGPPDANSVQLLKYYFEQYPEDASKVVLSMKSCYDPPTFTADCSPEAIRASIEGCLKGLGGTKKIDIFECARVDPNVPIETTIQALAEFVKAGKIGAIGLSEVKAETIRRAHAVHPIAAVEVELSLFTTDPLTNGVAATCQELGIALVAYSPLGSGFLAGKFRKYEDIPETAFVRYYGRFQPAVFDKNLEVVKAVEAIAKRKGATVGQVAIAWVRNQGAIPIPGASRVERVVENCEDVSLNEEDLAEIQTILDSMPVEGPRYGGKFEDLLNG